MEIGIDARRLHGELGFELAPKDSPISINGSISQNPADKLLGSFNAPFPSFMDTFARNAVNSFPCHVSDGC